MKKILSLVFITMLLISTIAKGEEIVDLTSMTIDELMNLRDMITEEVYSRLGFSFEDNQIGAGYYLVGTDIKAGKYEFICTFSETQLSYEGDRTYNLGTIWILSSDAEDAESLHEFGDVQVGEKYKFDLEEGQMLVIGRCNGVIQEYEHSWAP